MLVVRLLLICLLMLTLIGATPLEPSDALPFHAPKTKLQKSLDKLIQRLVLEVSKTKARDRKTVLRIVRASPGLEEHLRSVEFSAAAREISLEIADEDEFAALMEPSDMRRVSCAEWRCGDAITGLYRWDVNESPGVQVELYVAKTGDDAAPSIRSVTIFWGL